MEGSLSPNLIPSSASAQADIRVPVGVDMRDIEQKIKEIVDSI
ncbi:peptidase dimerization domain-containing protein [Aliicoccus persicus]